MDFNKINEIKTRLKERKNKIKKTVIIIDVIFLIVYIIVSYYIYSTSDFDLFNYICLCLPAGFVIVFVSTPLSRIFMAGGKTNEEVYEIYKEYSEKYIKRYLEETFGNLDYKPIDGLTKEKLQHGLEWFFFPDFKSFNYFAAKYKNMDVEFSRVFNNDFFYNYHILRFNKNFEAKCFISNSKHMFNNDLFSKIVTSNYEINDKFSVFVEKGKSFDYILTDSFLKRLLDLSNYFRNRNINIIFNNNMIFVSISTGYDFFEFNINKDITSDILKEKTLNEIKQITTCLDAFDFGDK